MNLLLRLCCLGLVVGITACTSSGPLKQQYFVLNHDSSAQLATIAGTPKISIRRVGVPEYLNQRGMARQISKGKISVSKDDLWAEPLSEAIPTVLAQHIAVIRHEPVEVNPLPPGIEVDTFIEVAISRLIADKTRLSIQASYRLINKKKLQYRQFASNIALSGSNTVELVESYNQAIQLLAKDIAAHLQ